MQCLFIDVQRKGQAARETVEFPSDGTLKLDQIADAAFALPYVRKVEIRQRASSSEILWGKPIREDSKKHSALAQDGQLEADLRAALGNTTVDKAYELRKSYLESAQR